MNARSLAAVLEWIEQHSRYLDDDLNDVKLTGVNQRCWNDDYPLHVLVRARRLEDMAVLIDHGADVNAPGERGMTPLHYAAMVGSAEVARLLLARGAKRTSLDEDMRTPLDWARTGGHSEVVSLLTNK